MPQLLNDNNIMYVGFDYLGDTFKIKNDTEYVLAITDLSDRFLFGIKQDGTVDWQKGIPFPIRTKLEDIYDKLIHLETHKANSEPGKTVVNETFANGISVISSEYYSYAVLDENNKFLFGVKTNGDFDFQNGLPFSIRKQLEAMDAKLTNKVDKEHNKGLVDLRFANGISIVSNEEYVFAVVDKEQKFLFGVRSNGEFDFAKGLPMPIRKEFEKQNFRGE